MACVLSSRTGAMGCVCVFMCVCFFLIGSGLGELYTSVSHIESSVEAARNLTQTLLSTSRKDTDAIKR